MTSHSSSCVFFNVFNGQYIVYEGTRLFCLPGLYTNDFGVSINEVKHKDANYKDFNLDSDKLNRIKKDILTLNLDAQIVALNVIENVLYRPAYL